MKVRVCVVQFVLPHYRVPFFHRLGQEPGIDLSIWASGRPWGSMKPAPPSDRFTFSPIRVGRVGPLLMHPASLAAAVSGRFDVLVLGWSSRTVDLLPALALARARGVRTILWGQGYSKRETVPRRTVRNLIGLAADAWLLYNRRSADILVAEGFPADRTFVALNSLDQSPIQAARTSWLERPNELVRFRAEHGLTEGQTMLFVSRLEPDKKVELLLEAFSRVLQARPAARLVLIGEGSSSDHLRVQARRLGIDHAILFVGSLYEESALAPWFLSAGVFVYPTAIGLSILHAFGYGLPVITSDNLPAHNPEIEALRSGENGLLYQEGSAESFAGRILELLDDPVRLQAMGRAARATVTEPGGFTLDTMTAGFLQAVQRVTGMQVGK